MTLVLADLCEVIVDCEHKTAPAGDGFALSVGTGAMKEGRLLIDECKPVSQSTYEAWTRRMTPEPGDLVLAREAPVGQVVRVPDHPPICLGQRTVLIRPCQAKVHPRFLHYWLLGPDAQESMAAKAAGATVSHLNVKDIRALDVRMLPDQRELQSFVAGVLGALDDLIENNRRQIQLLEQMAQAIYREWFVRFRYPGHEHVALIDSPLGLIPEGWQVKSLATVAKLTMGQSPPSQYYNTRGVGKPFHQGVTDFGLHFPVNRKYCSSDGRSASAGDILISVRAPVGRLNIALDDMTIGRGLAAACSRTDEQSLLFRALKDVVFAEEDAMGSGTIFRAIGKQELQRIQLVVPPRHIGTLAESQLANNSALLRALTLQGRTLGGIRDVLLPRLVTGQIDASSLDLDAVMDPEG